MGLLSDLGEGPVALDTSIFVYFLEEHPVYLPWSIRCSRRSTRASSRR
ncbi:MAG TPA: hypothetical protein VJ885_11290 [Thermoanaerobaculia bacterium]|nr:hypothetical protein [Thermoanaerobaculia bacterium]